MRKGMSYDGVLILFEEIGWWLLKVGAIVLFVVAIGVLFSMLSVSRVLGQQLEPLVLWQLGSCVHEPGDRPACVALGTPVPEGVCIAMKKRLVIEGFPGRPVCARVLVDG